MVAKEVVGFIGLGTMGAPMARNIAASYDTHVYDIDSGRTAEVAQDIANGTARRVVPAADAGALEACTIVVLMLPTSKDVREVLLAGSEPRIPLSPGSIVIDMSSSDPTDTVETGEALRAHGITLLDAPVSGAQPRAAAGTLAIMLGGDDDAALSRAEPVLDTMSRNVFRTGKLGTGHAMKALNNYVAGAAFAATSEALNAGVRFGLAPDVMVEVLNDSTGQSFSSSHVFLPHVVEEQFATGFALPLITKDIKIAEALFDAVRVPAPICRAVTSQFADALQALGDVDHTEAYKHWSATDMDR